MWDVLPLITWNDVRGIMLLVAIPTLAVFISVLFVNFFIPIRTRLQHSLATAFSSGIVWGAGALVAPNGVPVMGQVAVIAMGVFVADFISTFINFTNRIGNAIVTTIVYALLCSGVVISLIIHALRPF